MLKEVWWWWRQTGAGPFPASAAALTRKAGGRRACVGRAGRLRARQHSQNPRRRVLQPSSVCENLYQSRWWWWCATAGARLHVRIISQARKWWPRSPRNHACGNVLLWWEKLYRRLHSTAEKAPARLPLPSVLFLKFPGLFICQIVIQSRPE